MTWTVARKIISSRIAVAFVLLLTGLAIYGTSLNNHFLLDDESQVLQNNLIHSPANVGVFFLGSTMNQESSSLGGIYYKPVMSLAYSLLWWTAPGDPFPFHLFQLLLVIANAFLVLIFFRRYLSELAAFLMALLFLAHPLNSEVVLYIADLQDGLYTFFGLLALNLLAVIDILRWRHLIALSALLLLSLLSKESGVLYVATVLVYAAVYKRAELKKILLTVAVSLGAYMFLRVGVAHLTTLTYHQNQIGRASLEIRALTAPLVLFSYLWKFIFPRDITATQDWVITHATLVNFWLPLLAVSLVLGLSVWYSLRRLRLKNRDFAFFTFWVFMGMGFHSHLLNSLDGTVADRWFYYSSIGLLAMLGILIDGWALVRTPRAAVSVLIGAAVALGARSYVRSQDWYDNYTLCLHDLKIFPDSYDMHNNLGVELYRRGNVAAAKAEFERSVELAPGWDINWSNLGAAYSHEGNSKKAEECYLKSMEHGTYYLAYENYAMILMSEGRIEEAAAFVSEKALPLFPASETLNKISQSIHNKK